MHTLVSKFKIVNQKMNIKKNKKQELRTLKNAKNQNQVKEKSS